MKKFIQFLADKPEIFDFLRRIIESNYVSLKKVIREEFSLESISSQENILDVPCGTGEFCTLFSPDNYHGMDISEIYINYARKKYKREFFSGNAMMIDFDDGHFDKILMLGFLHHLDDSAVNSVLKEARRVLKPGGTMLLLEDAPTSSQWNIVGKALQKFDVGSNIRPAVEYKTVLKEYFTTVKSYHVTSGLWDYSVFVLSPNK